MIGFQYPIVAGTVLVIDAIQSPNYVAGASGWTINQDGSAEFNNVTVRGEFEVTGNNNSYILIWNQGTGIPVINLRPGDIPAYGGYNAAIEPAIIEAESIDGGSQNDSRPRMLLFSAYLNTANGLVLAPQISMEAASFDEATPPRIVINNPLNTLTVEFNDTLDIVSGGELQWSDGTNPYDTNLRRSGVAELRTDSSFWANGNVVIGGTIYFTDYGVDSGKARVGNAGSNANSAAITTTETAVVTSGNYTFRAGRAYSVTMTGIATLSVGPNRVVQRLRKNNTGGAQLSLSGAHMISTSSGSVDWEGGFYVTGADVTCALAWTGVTGTAAFSVVYQGSVSPLKMKIYDIGPAADYSAYLTQLT